MHCADVALFGSIRHRKGLAGALVPPAISLSLLALDQMWWTEHAGQVAARMYRLHASPGCIARMHSLGAQTGCTAWVHNRGA